MSTSETIEPELLISELKNEQEDECYSEVEALDEVLLDASDLNSLDFLKEELQEPEPKKPLNSCTKCHKKFKSEHQLHKHLLSHGIKPYKCQEDGCGKSFKRASDLKTHNVIHTGERKYKCSHPGCDKSFSQSSHMRCHLETHNEVKNHVCTICDKAFHRAINLKIHMLGHSTLKSFKCEVCHKGFNKPSILRRHLQIHKGEKRYVCSSCGRAFSQKGNLNKHLLTHSGVKDYECVCGKRFAQRHQLLAHQVIHSDQKEFLCSSCGKAFNRQSSLEKHLLLHDGVRAHICGVCTKSFVLKSHLTKHLKSHTEKFPFPERTRSIYTCETCNEIFHSLSNFKVHKLSHNGVKIYKCDQCERLCSRENGLKKHKKSHARSLSCPICKREFKQSFNLKRHVALHSNNKLYSAVPLDELKKNPNENVVINIQLPNGDINFTQKISVPQQKPALETKRRATPGFESYQAGQSLLKLKPVMKNQSSLVKKPKVMDQPKPIEVSSDQSRNDTVVLQTTCDSLETIEEVESHIILNEQDLNLIPTPNSSEPVYRTIQVQGSDGHSTLFHIQVVEPEPFDNPQITFEEQQLNQTVSEILHQMPSNVVDHNNVSTLEENNKQIFIETLDVPVAKEEVTLGGYQILNDCNSEDPDQNDSYQELPIPTLNPIFNEKDIQVIYNTVTECDDGDDINWAQEIVSTTSPDVVTRANEDPEEQINSLVASLDCRKLEDAFDAEENREILRTNFNFDEVKQKNACPYCKRTFMSAVILQRHIDSHLASEKVLLECKTCKQTFKGTDEYRDHITNHPDKTLYYCDICLKNFVRKSDLVSHMKTHSSLKAYQCDVCFRSFTHASSLRNHKPLHSGIRSFLCNRCGKSFVRAGDLRSHSLTHSSQKNFQCDMCQKSFTLRSTLRSHLMTHYPGNSKPYACPDCDKTFSQSSSLKSHMMTHSSSKMFTCKLCKKAFKTPAYLKKHLYTHSGQKTAFSCEICGRGFARLAHLRTHNIVHTKEKNFYCTESGCGKSFTLKSSLTRHMLLHNGPHRPYVCPECQKGFTQSAHLKKHMQSHRGLKMYSCEICSKSFSVATSLKKHLLQHSKSVAHNDIDELKSSFMSSHSNMFTSESKRLLIEQHSNLLSFHSSGLESEHGHHQLFEHHDLDSLT